MRDLCIKVKKGRSSPEVRCGCPRLSLPKRTATSVAVHTLPPKTSALRLPYTVSAHALQYIQGRLLSMQRIFYSSLLMKGMVVGAEGEYLLVS